MSELQGFLLSRISSKTMKRIDVWCRRIRRAMMWMQSLRSSSSRLPASRRAS
jgi:hypothetical protein